MNPQPITAADFRNGISDLKELINSKFAGVDTRFDGVDQRLDVANGRMNKHDSAIGKLEPAVAAHTESLRSVGIEIRDLKDARKVDAANERQARWSTAQMLLAFLSALLVAYFAFWLRGAA